MALDPLRIPFGLSTISIGEEEDDDFLAFDGVNEFQAEGGEVTLTPQFEEIVIADFGTSIYDYRLVGWEGEVTFSAAQESIEVLQTAIAASNAVENADGDTVGFVDAKIGTSMRSKAKKVRVHPRQLGDDKTLDIVIYKMVSTGEFTRGAANEQGNIPITLSILPKDGMDANSDNNFFHVGDLTDEGEAQEAEPA